MEFPGQVQDQLPFFQTFANKSNNPTIELAAKLIEVAPVPMSKVMFQNSGSEAIDTAIKLVWYYQNARGKSQKKKISPIVVVVVPFGFCVIITEESIVEQKLA